MQLAAEAVRSVMLRWAVAAAALALLLAEEDGEQRVCAEREAAQELQDALRTEISQMKVPAPLLLSD